MQTQTTVKLQKNDFYLIRFLAKINISITNTKTRDSKNDIVIQVIQKKVNLFEEKRRILSSSFVAYYF